jgi:hypothetical protein
MEHKFKAGDSVILVAPASNTGFEVGDRLEVEGYYGCGHIKTKGNSIHWEEEQFALSCADKSSCEVKPEATPETIPVKEVIDMLKKLALLPMFYSRGGAMPVLAFQDMFAKAVKEAGLLEQLYKDIQ